MPSNVEQFATGLLRGGKAGYQQRTAERRKRKREQDIASLYDIATDPSLSDEEKRAARGSLFATTGQRFAEPKPPDTGIPYKSPEIKDIIGKMVKIAGFGPEHEFVIAEPGMTSKEAFAYLMDPKNMKPIELMTIDDYNIMAEAYQGLSGKQLKAKTEVMNKQNIPKYQQVSLLQKESGFITGQDRTNNLGRVNEIMTDSSGNEIPLGKIPPSQIREMQDLGFTVKELKNSQDVASANKTDTGSILYFKDIIIKNMLRSAEKKIEISFAADKLAAAINKTPSPNLEDYSFIREQVLQEAIKFQEYKELPPEHKANVETLKKAIDTTTTSKEQFIKFMEEDGRIPPEFIPFYIEAIYGE